MPHAHQNDADAFLTGKTFLERERQHRHAELREFADMSTKQGRDELDAAIRKVDAEHHEAVRRLAAAHGRRSDPR